MPLNPLIKIVWRDHADRLCSSLQQLLDLQEMCDVRFQLDQDSGAGGRDSVCAHRVMLAASSGALRQKLRLCGDNGDGAAVGGAAPLVFDLSSDKSSWLLPEQCPPAQLLRHLRHIVHIVYCGRAEVRQADIAPLLVTARHLRFDQVCQLLSRVAAARAPHLSAATSTVADTITPTTSPSVTNITEASAAVNTVDSGGERENAALIGASPSSSSATPSTRLTSGADAEEESAQCDQHSRSSGSVGSADVSAGVQTSCAVTDTATTSQTGAGLLRIRSSRELQQLDSGVTCQLSGGGQLTFCSGLSGAHQTEDAQSSRHGQTREHDSLPPCQVVAQSDSCSRTLYSPLTHTRRTAVESVSACEMVGLRAAFTETSAAATAASSCVSTAEAAGATNRCQSSSAEPARARDSRVDVSAETPDTGSTVSAHTPMLRVRSELELRQKAAGLSTTQSDGTAETRCGSDGCAFLPTEEPTGPAIGMEAGGASSLGCVRVHLPACQLSTSQLAATAVEVANANAGAHDDDDDLCALTSDGCFSTAAAPQLIQVRADTQLSGLADLQQLTTEEPLFISQVERSGLRVRADYQQLQPLQVEPTVVASEVNFDHRHYSNHNHYHHREEVSFVHQQDSSCVSLSPTTAAANNVSLCSAPVSSVMCVDNMMDSIGLLSEADIASSLATPSAMPHAVTTASTGAVSSSHNTITLADPSVVRYFNHQQNHHLLLHQLPPCSIDELHASQRVDGAPSLSCDAAPVDTCVTLAAMSPSAVELVPISDDDSGAAVAEMAPLVRVRPQFELHCPWGVGLQAGGCADEFSQSAFFSTPLDQSAISSSVINQSTMSAYSFDQSALGVSIVDQSVADLGHVQRQTSIATMANMSDVTPAFCNNKISDEHSSHLMFKDVQFAITGEEHNISVANCTAATSECSSVEPPVCVSLADRAALCGDLGAPLTVPAQDGADLFGGLLIGSAAAGGGACQLLAPPISVAPDPSQSPEVLDDLVSNRTSASVDLNPATGKRSSTLSPNNTTKRRRGRVMIPLDQLRVCQLCGAKFATLSQLQTHISNTHASLLHTNFPSSSTNTTSCASVGDGGESGNPVAAASCRATDPGGVSVEARPHATTGYDTKMATAAAGSHTSFTGSTNTVDKAQTGSSADTVECRVCGFSITPPDTLYQHICSSHPTHWGSLKQCVMCGYTSDRTSAVRRHMTNVHQLDASGRCMPPDHKCPHCTFVTHSLDKFKLHVQQQHGAGKRFKCGQCNYSSVAKQAVQKHQLIVHSTDRPYHCEICGFRAATLSRISRHRRSHTQERPYSCRVCGARYTEARRLREHVHDKHGAAATSGGAACASAAVVARFTCAVCGVTFRRRDNMRKHVICKHPNHTGEGIA